MASLDDLPPEEHRRRYEALLAGARARAAARQVAAPAPLDPDRIIARETIPGGWYHTLRVRRGEALRLVNTSATPGISLLLWNAHETSERLNMPDTLKVQWTARLTAAHVLLSDMGRVLATIIADDCGWHDGITGGSTPLTSPGLRNTRDNFLRAAGKLGLGARDLPPCLTLFAPVQIDAAGKLAWRDGMLRPGQAVDLVAAMDLLAVISNCAHPLAPPTDPAPIDAITFRPDAGADQPARAGLEAARAFENTERLDA